MPGFCRLVFLTFLAWPAGQAPAQGFDPRYDEAARSAQELLSELVAADLTNPPGNESRAAALCAARLKKAGIPFEITEFGPGRQNLVARLRGSGTEGPLLLLAHTDVVTARGQTWTSDPYRMKETGGYLVGRGVLDDLSMAAVELEVFLLLKRSGTPLRRDVILAWTGDEESGGKGIQYLLEKKPESIRADLALNEGGGIVLGEDGKPKYIALQVAEKIYQDFELVARGPTGHSSVPLADNAIYRLSRVLDRLGRHRFPARLLEVTRAFLEARAALEPPELARAMRRLSRSKGGLPAQALRIVEVNPTLSATLRTTCVATLVSGGTRANALPSEAKTNVNCRILPDETQESVRTRLLEVLADPQVEVRRVEDFRAAGPSPLGGPGPEAIRKVAQGMWPGLPIIPSMSRGATDSRYLREAGIPSYGIHPVALTEEDGRRAHGIDERIPASSLRSGVEFLHKLVLELAAGKES